MPDLKNYPQIPSAIWWGFREMLINKPSIQISAKLVAIQFDVQETAAKAYIRELQKIGMLDEDGRPTPVALKWRMDDSYSEAVAEILATVYPDELREILDVKAIDKAKAKQWFQYDGLGTGAAGNKTATLVVIASPTPGEAQKLPTTKPEVVSRKAPAKKEANVAKAAEIEKQKAQKGAQQKFNTAFPMNLNIQIHISADSSNEQIETIFRSMNKYLSSDES